MKTYKCHKTVKAFKISKIEPARAGEHRLSSAEGDQVLVMQAWLDKHNPAVGGYFVVYKDGYESYSPAESFEDGYDEQKTGMSFGDAIEQLKSGYLVARSGWNGKDMFLLLVPGSRFQVNRHPLLGIFPEGTAVDYCPHIDMKTADGKIVPWSATQTDVLADDWLIVDPQ
jgi:hypothetical protein